jgi:hypothetical protein
MILVAKFVHQNICSKAASYIRLLYKLSVGGQCLCTLKQRVRKPSCSFSPSSSHSLCPPPLPFCFCSHQHLTWVMGGSHCCLLLWQHSLSPFFSFSSTLGSAPLATCKFRCSEISTPALLSACGVMGYGSMLSMRGQGFLE